MKRHKTIERLRKALEVFRAVPDERVAMGFWWCETVGCFAGHYAASREGRDDGFTLYEDSPKYKRHKSAMAVKMFFRLGADEVSDLMGYRAPSNKAAVITKIEQFIKQLEASQ